MKKTLTRKELWNLYWLLNVVKVTLFLVRMEHSLNRRERELLRKLEKAWSE